MSGNKILTKTVYLRTKCLLLTYSDNLRDHKANVPIKKKNFHTPTMWPPPPAPDSQIEGKKLKEKETKAGSHESFIEGATKLASSL